MLGLLSSYFPFLKFRISCINNHYTKQNKIKLLQIPFRVIEALMNCVLTTYLK